MWAPKKILLSYLIVPFHGLGPSSRLMDGLLIGITISGITISGLGTVLFVTLVSEAVFADFVAFSFITLESFPFPFKSLWADPSLLAFLPFDFEFAKPESGSQVSSSVGFSFLYGLSVEIAIIHIYIY